MTTPTQKPAPGTVGCDTSDMVLVHRVFRYLFRDAPRLVREVDPGDRERTAIVAAHVRDIAGGLHNHHHTEDILLWDTLEQRSPGCALHIGLMRTQHAEVATLLEELEGAVPAWEARAGAAERDRVADLLDRVLVSLETHLGAEEERILPVAGSTMTQAEWDRLGEHARRELPKDKQFEQLGWVIEALGPQEGARFVKEMLPAAVRVLWRVVGRRQFAAHRRAVYGV